MRFFGSSALFLYMSILSAIYIVFAVWRVFHARAPQDEEQSDYLPLPRATSLAFYLDPRSDLGSEEGYEDEEEGGEYPYAAEDEEEEE